MATPRKGTPSSPVTPRTRTISAPRSGASLTPSSSKIRTTASSSRGTANLAPSTRAPGPIARTKSPARPIRPATPPAEPKTPVSIREAIALKRAEAKKAKLDSRSLKHAPSLDTISHQTTTDVDADLSRWSIKDSIERARSSGSLNLSSRSLASPPTALFEVHLGITPEPLKLAPKESEEDLYAGKTKQRSQTAWFEAVDLTVLKLRDNVIVEIQPEISLFGSLKTLDLHNNRLTVLPDTLGDLVNLVTLDLSSNQLSTLPPDIATLPLLTILNVSSNQLTSLPLTVTGRSGPSQNLSDSFFAPATIERASKPLPSLRQLLAAANKLGAEGLPVEELPSELTKCDLRNNPLGDEWSLINALSHLQRLKELLLESTEITDESFKSVKGFPSLELLELSKTKVTENISETFQGRAVSWQGENIEGGVRIVLGTQVQKEAWEIEADRRTRGRAAASSGQGLAIASTPEGISASRPAEPIKESWEIEAEQGLLTEGGRRRARAAAAEVVPDQRSPSPSTSSSSTRHKSTTAFTQYYDQTHASLTLPRSLPRTHSRARSLAPSTSDVSDPTVPAPTLPLPVILTQSFAQNIRVLVLTNRRLDPSFLVPSISTESDPLLPALNELQLDGCNLGDLVPVTTDGDSTSPRKDPIFSIIAALFPSITYLDLSDNKLTSLAGVRALLIPDPSRRTQGLRVLKLRGNKINDLIGLEAVAQVIKSEGTVEAWRLEELDLRENEIAKLPPILGYLPLDVLLVEGNTFRVPARRVWERDGTKGLLTWLKDRVE